MASPSVPRPHHSTSVAQNLAKTKRIHTGSAIPKKFCDFVFRRNVDNQVYRSESFRFIQKTDTFLTPEGPHARRSFKVPVNENYIDPVDYQINGKEEPAYNEIVEPYNAPYYYSDTIKDPTYYSPCPVRKNSNHYNSRRLKCRGQAGRQSLSLTKSSGIQADGEDLSSESCDSNSIDKLLVSIKLESLEDECLSSSPKHNQYISICHIRTSPDSTLTTSSSLTEAYNQDPNETNAHANANENKDENPLRCSHRYLKASAFSQRGSHMAMARNHHYTESVTFYQKDDRHFASGSGQQGEPLKKVEFEFSPSTNVSDHDLNSLTDLATETFKQNNYDHSDMNEDRIHQGKDLPFGANGNLVKATRGFGSNDSSANYTDTAAEVSITTKTDGNGVLNKNKCVNKSCEESEAFGFCDNALMGSDHFYSSVGRNLSCLGVGVAEVNNVDQYQVSLPSLTNTNTPENHTRLNISNSKCEYTSNEDQQNQNHLVPYSAKIVGNTDLNFNTAQNDGNYVKPHLCWGTVDFKYPLSLYQLELDPSMSLENQDWFHGSITRLESEQILKATKVGSFLVRNCENSSRNHFSLSIKCSRGFIHIRIEPNSRGTYTLGDKDFPSVPYLIHHFMLHRLPIKGAEHFKLMYPVITQLL